MYRILILVSLAAGLLISCSDAVQKRTLDLAGNAAAGLASGEAAGERRDKHREKRIRDITRRDGSRATLYRSGNGDTRVRNHGDPADGSRDRVYGRGFTVREVVERERGSSER